MPAERLEAALTVVRRDFSLEVTLSVGPGLTAVVGPSGAGKTTLLRALAGLEPEARGEVRLDGRELHALPPERRRVGFVFQRPALFTHLSVLENVSFGAHDARVGAAWLSRVGLQGFERRRVSSLSGGEQQRVALARTLATEPSWLLLDEPFTSLDAGARGSLLSLVHELVESSRLIALMVTHDESEAVRLKSRLVRLSAGRLTDASEG